MIIYIYSEVSPNLKYNIIKNILLELSLKVRDNNFTFQYVAVDLSYFQVKLKLQIKTLKFKFVVLISPHVHNDFTFFCILIEVLLYSKTALLHIDIHQLLSI